MKKGTIILISVIGVAAIAAVYFYRKAQKYKTAATASDQQRLADNVASAAAKEAISFQNSFANFKL